MRILTNYKVILWEREAKMERELRLSLEELQASLRCAKLVKGKEIVYEARIEPGELVVKIVK